MSGAAGDPERAEVLRRLRRLADEALLEFKLSLADSGLSVEEQTAVLQAAVEPLADLERELQERRGEPS